MSQSLLRQEKLKTASNTLDRLQDMYTGHTYIEADGPDGEASWELEAKCRGGDTEYFYRRGTAAQKEAANFCKGCPVIQQCGEYALMNGIDVGVWGGMTERDRRKLSRKIA